uniref:Hydroxypyruvate isomerase (putative) n=1 Tax=Rhinopithecus bieti TaxID=61621 RepID=A0A2K6L7U5_RHIBE
MAALRFSANLSWLFPELLGLPARLRAAGSSGFEAVEVAWPYAEPPEVLARAAREAGLRLVLINTPPGDQEKGEMGLGAVPGRQAAFRQGLEQAVRYAKALGCPSIPGKGAVARGSLVCSAAFLRLDMIHLMAGRVPQGADRRAVKAEMEIVFLENLRHAAGVLAQEDLVGLLEPINTRITDPQYFLDTPQQAAAILQKVGRPNLQLQMDIFHWQIMDGNLTGNIRESFLCPPTLSIPTSVLQALAGGSPAAPERSSGGTGQGLFSPCRLRCRGDTVEGLSWLRSYWDRRGHPEVAS